jgi:hypothetical protein
MKKAIQLLIVNGPSRYPDIRDKKVDFQQQKVAYKIKC